MPSTCVAPTACSPAERSASRRTIHHPAQAEHRSDNIPAGHQAQPRYAAAAQTPPPTAITPVKEQPLRWRQLPGGIPLNLRKRKRLNIREMTTAFNNYFV
jgi:hypothetical protein